MHPFGRRSVRGMGQCSYQCTFNHIQKVKVATQLCRPLNEVMLGIYTAKNKEYDLIY